MASSQTHFTSAIVGEGSAPLISESENTKTDDFGRFAGMAAQFSWQEAEAVALSGH